MSKKILVAYATWAGSTAEVGEAIAKILRSPAFDVDVLPAKEVHDLTAYHGLVLGTPIRMSTPHRDVRNFVRKFKRELAILPTAVFVVCLNMSEDNEQNQIQTEGYLHPLYRSSPGCKPVSTGLFGGVMDATKLKGFWRLVMASTLQGDFRRWEKINAWAEAIKPLLGCG